MSIRHFTRLANAFSKKVENHAQAIAIHFIQYNYSRIQQTLRVTPAMQFGLSDYVWELEELVGLLESDEVKMIVNGALKRGAYREENARLKGES
jgi:hypothetical protein